MSSYVNKKTRVFREAGDIEVQRKRSDGRMKTYTSATDARAWCDSTEQRRQHILDLVRQGDGKGLSLGKYIPIEAIIDILLSNKNADIKRLLQEIEELKKFIKDNGLQYEEKPVSVTEPEYTGYASEPVEEPLFEKRETKPIGGGERQYGEPYSSTTEPETTTSEDLSIKARMLFDEDYPDIGKKTSLGGSTKEAQDKEPSIAGSKISGGKEAGKASAKEPSIAGSTAFGKETSIAGSVKGSPVPTDTKMAAWDSTLPIEEESVKKVVQYSESRAPPSSSGTEEMSTPFISDSSDYESISPDKSPRYRKISKEDEKAAKAFLAGKTPDQQVTALKDALADKEAFYQAENSLAREAIEKLESINEIVNGDEVSLKSGPARLSTSAKSDEGKDYRKIEAEQSATGKAVTDKSGKSEADKTKYGKTEDQAGSPGYGKTSIPVRSEDAKAATTYGKAEDQAATSAYGRSEAERASIGKQPARRFEDQDNCRDEIETLEREIAAMKTKSSPESDIIQREVQVLKKYCAKLAAIQNENSDLRQERDLLKTSGDPVLLEKLNRLDDVTQERDRLRARVEQLERELGGFSTLPDQVSAFKERSARVDSLREEEGDLRKRLSSLSGLENDVKALKVKADKSVEAAGDSTERDALLKRIAELEKEHENCKCKLKELEILKVERNCLKMRNEDLARIQRDYEDLLKKTQGFEACKAECAKYKAKYEELKKLEGECNELRNKVQRVAELENERQLLMKEIEDCECCMNNQEGEIKKLACHIDCLTQDLDRRQDEMKCRVLTMRSDIEKKDSLITKSEQQLADVQQQLRSSIEHLSCETTCLRNRIEELEQEVQENHKQLIDKDSNYQKLEDELRTKIKDLETDVESEKITCTKLNEALRKAIQSDEHLKQMLKQTKCAIKCITQKLEKHDIIGIGRLETERENYLKKIKDLEEGLTEQNFGAERIEILEAQLEQSRGVYQCLKDHYDQLREENETLKKLSLELQKSAKSKVTKMEESAEDNCQELKNALIEKEKLIELLKHDLETEKGRKLVPSGDVDATELARLKGQVSVLQAEIDRLQLELDKERRECDDNIKKLKNKMEAMEEDATTIRKLEEQNLESSTDINRYRKENELLKAEMDKLKSKVVPESGDTLKDENKALKDAIDSKETETKKLKEEMNKLTQKLTSQEDEIKKLKEEIKRLKEELESKTEKDDVAFSKERDDLLKQIAAQKKEIADLLNKMKEPIKTDDVSTFKELEAKSKENDKLKAMIDDLEKKLKGLEKKNEELGDLEKRLKVAEDLNKEYQKQQSNLEQQLKEAQGKNKDYEKAQAELEKQLKEVESKNKDYQKAQSDLEKKLVEADNKNKDYQSQLKVGDESQKELESMRSKIADLEKQLKEAENKIKENEVQLKEMTKASNLSDDQKKENEKQRTTIQNLEKQLQELQDKSKENEKLKAMIEDLEKQLQGANDRLKEIDNLKSTISKLEDQLKEAQKVPKDVPPASPEIDKVVQDLQQSIEKEEEKVKALEDALKKAQEEIDSLKKLENDLKKCEEEREAFKKKITELEKNCDDLKNEIADTELLQASGDVDDQVKKLQEELAKRKKECNDMLGSLKEQYDRDIKNLQKQNEAAIDKLQNAQQETIKTSSSDYEGQIAKLKEQLREKEKEVLSIKEASMKEEEKGDNVVCVCDKFPKVIPLVVSAAPPCTCTTEFIVAEPEQVLQPQSKYPLSNMTPTKDEKVMSIKKIMELENKLLAKQENTKMKIGNLQGALDRVKRELELERQRNNDLVNRYTNQSKTVANMTIEMDIVKKENQQDKRKLQRLDMALKNILNRGCGASHFVPIPHFHTELTLKQDDNKVSHKCVTKRTCNCNQGDVSTDSFEIDE